MPNFTPNYGLAQPLVNNATDQDLWGGQLNTDMDDIDGLILTGMNFVTSAETTSFNVIAPTAQSITTGSAKTLFLCDATSGAIVASLPSASSAGNGFTVAFKKIDAGVNAVVPTVTGSDTIDGALTFSISKQWGWLVLISDGVSTWNVISDEATLVQKNFSVNVQTFTTSGTYTPTSGIVNCIVEMVAGGGGGGSCVSGSGGGGGGSGGYLKVLLTSAQIGAAQSITIGSAGTAGSTSNGGAGGTTSIGSLVSCAGGSGGLQNTSNVSTVAGGAGGGATVTTGTALVNLTGQAGSSGSGDFLLAGGSGGSNPLGFGGPVAFGVPGASPITGPSGSGYGSGGAGGSSAGNGGAGAAGYVVITEYIYV